MKRWFWELDTNRKDIIDIGVRIRPVINLKKWEYILYKIKQLQLYLSYSGHWYLKNDKKPNCQNGDYTTLNFKWDFANRTTVFFSTFTLVINNYSQFCSSLTEPLIHSFDTKALIPLLWVTLQRLTMQNPGFQLNNVYSQRINNERSEQLTYPKQHDNQFP